MLIKQFITTAMLKKISLLLVGFCSVQLVLAQPTPRTDKANFINSKPGYYQNTIMRGIQEQAEATTPPKTQRYMKMDISGINVPQSPSEFTGYWKNEPVSQGNTGTCWSFSTTSYFETEVYRITKQQIKLSELFNVYWEYVDKAKGFVSSRGTSLFEEGSEANGVVRVMRNYGCMPMDVYDGLQIGAKFHDHSKMIEEMHTYLNSVKASANWNEETVIKTIQAILDHYIGTPPTQFSYKGKNYTPKSFQAECCKLNPDDYVDVISLMEQPYWTRMEYKVPDNWWHDANYYNVPLDTFMLLLISAIKSGYTLTIGGDVSEPGFNINNVCMIPSWDIPSNAINQEARQFRFYNKTTTDDHGMHLIGYEEKNGSNWYLVKDSGAGSRNVGKESASFGFYYFHEDYIRLKIMDFLVHKDVLKAYLPKFK